MATRQEGSWKVRRTIIIVTLGICAYVVLKFTIMGGEDTELNTTLVNGAYFLAGSVIGAYVFGAVWDDKNMGGLSRRRRRDESDSTYDYGGQ